MINVYEVSLDLILQIFRTCVKVLYFSRCLLLFCHLDKCPLYVGMFYPVLKYNSNILTYELYTYYNGITVVTFEVPIHEPSVL